MFRTLRSKAATLAAGIALGSAFFAGPATHAQSATITITDSTCSGFTAGGSAGALTITCNGSSGGSGPPTGCAVSGPTTASTGQNTAITVACTGGAALTSYAWTGGSCATQSTPACNANESGAGQVQYGVTVGNGNGSNVTATPWTVTWVSGGVAPSGCTATANPAGPLAAGGGSTTISVSCASGAPTSYSWSSSPAIAGLQPTTTVGTQGPLTITQSTNFSVTPSNGTGAGNLASVSVSVQTGGGGGGSLANCTNQGFTVLNGSAAAAPWGVANRWNAASGFGDGVVWVIAITPPAGTANSTNAGSFSVSEFGGNNSTHQMTISALPCDFRNLDATGANGPFAVSNGNSAQVGYYVGPNYPGYFGFTAGQTYYVNVRNWSIDRGTWSCGGSSCPAYVDNNPATP